MVYLQISGNDPHRPEDTYFEVVDTLFEATRIAGMMVLAFWMARHQSETVLSSATSGEC